MCHQMLSLDMGSDFVHLLVEQLQAKEVFFYGFVTKSNNPVYHALNIHPHGFNNFHMMTIIHGDSHGNFTSPSPSNSFPTFHHRTSPFCCPPSISSLELSKKLRSKFITSPHGKRSQTAAPEL